MISVILSILKFILVILACIIGLVLLIICLVLFIPIRYETSGKLDDNIMAKGRVSWLLRILSLRVSYIEEVLKVKITVFGISIFDSEKAEDKRDNNEFDMPRKDVTKKRILNKHKKSKDTKKDNENEQVQSEQEIEKVKTIQDSQAKKDLEKKDDNILKKRLDKAIDKKSKDKNKRNIKTVIKETLKSLKDLTIKIVKTIISILVKIYNFLLQIEPDEELSTSKFSKVKSFIKENKPGFKAIIKAVKDLLKHIKPTKCQGDVEFGMDDPSSTGQILGLVSIFHGSYYKSLRITPNFEERIIKGQIFLKGRIRLFTILIIILKLILNKSFKILWNNYKVLKEEL